MLRKKILEKVADNFGGKEEEKKERTSFGDKLKDGIQSEVVSRVAEGVVDNIEDKFRNRGTPSNNGTTNSAATNSNDSSNGVKGKLKEKVQGTIQDKALLTTLVYVVANLSNLALIPAYKYDTRVGFGLSFGMNVLLTLHLYKLGVNSSAAREAISKVGTFFATQDQNVTTELKKILMNVINGGDEVFEQYAPAAFNPGK